MGELLNKIKQLAKGGMIDAHGNMLRIKYNAVLVIINVRRILESPPACVNFNRNYAVVLP